MISDCVGKVRKKSLWRSKIYLLNTHRLHRAHRTDPFPILPYHIVRLNTWNTPLFFPNPLSRRIRLHRVLHTDPFSTLPFHSVRLHTWNTPLFFLSPLYYREDISKTNRHKKKSNHLKSHQKKIKRRIMNLRGAVIRDHVVKLRES